MKKQRACTAVLFALCLLLLTWIIVFKATLPYKGMFLRRSLNLIPFYVRPAESFYKRMAFSDWTMNLAAFVPFGVCAGVLLNRHPVWVPVAAGFGTSLLFEVVQYITGLGATDITDLITNTAGTVAGLLLYRLLLRLLGESRSVTAVNAAGILFVAGALLLRVLRFYGPF